MSKYRVRGVEREGHAGVWRADRLWPHTGVDVEVLDIDEVPNDQLQAFMDLPVHERPAYVYEATASSDKHGPKSRIARRPNVVGRNFFKLMQADGRLSINRLDGAVAPAEVQVELKKRDGVIDGLRAQVEALQIENARLRAKPKPPRETEGDDDDDDDASARVTELEAEALAQKNRIAALERELVASRTAPAAAPPAPAAPPEDKSPQLSLAPPTTPPAVVAAPAAPPTAEPTAQLDTGKPAGKKR